MNDEELDVVEFTDDEGNSLLLQVVDNFFYNGEEFAVLTEWDEACDCEDCGASHGHAGAHGELEAEEDEDEDEDDEEDLYIMKVNTFIDENGEEMEEFTPVDDDLMDKLIEIVRTRFHDEGDEDDGEAGHGENE